MEFDSLVIMACGTGVSIIIAICASSTEKYRIFKSIKRDKIKEEKDNIENLFLNMLRWQYEASKNILGLKEGLENNHFEFKKAEKIADEQKINMLILIYFRDLKDQYNLIVNKYKETLDFLRMTDLQKILNNEENKESLIRSIELKYNEFYREFDTMVVMVQDKADTLNKA